MLMFLLFIGDQYLYILIICQVHADMPLDDILNQFQKGSSHMTALLKSKNNMKPPSVDEDKIMDGTISKESYRLSFLLSST